MRLYTMLTERQDDILAMCREKVDLIMSPRPATGLLDEGISTLYDQLTEVLRISLEEDTAATRSRFVADTVAESVSRHHAQEAYRLGYTVSQLVHGYGSICQGITEYAHNHSEPITAAEFSQLNLSLDVAIAQAVSEFEILNAEHAGLDESIRLGYIAHALRNYLSSAMMAHELIRQGGVGAAGAISQILSAAHEQMKQIIDRAVAEVRMGGELAVEQDTFALTSLLSEVESTALSSAVAKSILLQTEMGRNLFVKADRHLLASAIANLVNNAIKFTKIGGHVLIRSFAANNDAVIEISDECGGIDDGHIELLFKPFVQENDDKSGLGLGLSIARRAVTLNGGSLTARNQPGVGCVFTVRLPAVERERTPVQSPKPHG